MTKDIGEKENLAEKNPGKLKELAALWDQWNAGNIDAAWIPGPPKGGGGRAKKNADPTQPGTKPAEAK